MRHSFPFYKQLDAMDCGPACLRMITKFYGKNFTLQTLRERSYITKRGVSLLGISDAAESIGMRSMGVKISFERLKKAPLPCIVHWKQEHFIVVYKITKSKVFVANPASDNVTVTMIENLPLVEYSDTIGITSVAMIDAKAGEATTYTIRIYNSQSFLLSTWTRSGKDFNIPLINMRDGTYIIEVSDGENSYRQQLIVKHN